MSGKAERRELPRNSFPLTEMMIMLGSGIGDRWIEDEVKVEPRVGGSQPTECALLNRPTKNPAAAEFGGVRRVHG
ncbi:hypothetical protein N7533_005314 [Penicillium manginii]|jgi:hypothetical protein|uniref:uncharacterized protein n=1 Tax=Penicillium manginii TaxID=203109 RepID=UPI00254907FA|nr:uncharacterized protein N7533_005314 [Penicillium manginii]KAJ5755771.1 hypothetical protein N7533_005314 [Penicillium manginii]